MSTPFRAFHWSTRAWYAPACKRLDDIGEEVTLGHYCDDGGTTGEMTMKWHSLNNRFVPRLDVFNDAWATLASMPDLIAALGKLDDENITAEAFVALLKELGFKDLTAYETPARYRESPHPIP